MAPGFVEDSDPLASYQDSSYLRLTLETRHDRQKLTIHGKTGAHLSPQPWEKRPMTDYQSGSRFHTSTNRQRLPIYLLTAVQGHRMWGDMLGTLAVIHTGKQLRTQVQKGASHLLGTLNPILRLHCLPSELDTRSLTQQADGRQEVASVGTWQPVSPGRCGWVGNWVLLLSFGWKLASQACSFGFLLFI